MGFSLKMLAMIATINAASQLRHSIRRISFALVTLVLCAGVSRAQHWTFANPIPTSSTLTRAIALEPGVFIAGGDNGTVAMSTDAGVTWSSRIVELRDIPTKLVFAEGGTLWSVGASYSVARSDDRGITWKILFADTMIPTLYDVYFRDSQHGMLLAERTVINGITISLHPIIMRTSDGGNNWTTEFTSMGFLRHLDFVDTLHGYLVADGLWRTNDGGATWQEIPSVPNGGISDVKFFDLAHGISWSGADNRMRMSITADSGFTWTALLDTAVIVSSASIVNDKEFWVNTYWTLLRTMDQGKSWTTMFTSSSGQIYDFTSDGSTLIVLCAGGVIWRSIDNGETWTCATTGSRARVRAMTFVDSTGWAVGDVSASASAILRSADRGKQWKMNLGPIGSPLYSVAFPSDSVGWLGGDYGMLLKTTDSGDSWVPVDISVFGAIRQIQFLDEHHGWLVSSDGGILWTENGGNSWQAASVNVATTELNDIQMTDLRHGFAVGAANTLLRTRDGGKTWESRGIPVSCDYYGVRFLDSLKGFAAGSGGHVVGTRDGGESWYPLNFSTPTLRSIAFVGRDTGFVVGDAGTLLMTPDGGVSWSTHSSGTSGTLYSAVAFPGLGAWIAGENGTILHWVEDETTSVASINVRRPSPEAREYSLLQNYPNPFNPTTVISCQWPTACDVDLSVYDVLGRTVATLAHGRYLAGRYAFRFGSPRLSSGVYYYRLKAGSYVATKSMVLVH